MRTHFPSTVLLFAIVTSLLTFSMPGTRAWSGSAEETVQTGILSGLTGQATAQGPGAALEPRPLKFRDAIVSGEQIATNAAATAEILWGKTTLLTLFEQSTVQITTEQPGQTVVRITAGTIRVAVAGSEIGPEETVIIETPTARVVTRGGIFQATATPVTRTSSVSDLQQKSLVHQVSYIYLSQTVAAAASATETVQVLEGEADVITGGATPERRSIGKGQELFLEGGRLREQTEARQSTERPILLAAVSPHALTPEPGTQQLIAGQVEQANALGQALMGETEESETSSSASKTKDTILSTSLGVNLPAGANALIKGFFGTPPAIASASTGVIDAAGDTNLSINIGVARPQASRNPGGGGLLLFHNSSVSMDKAVENGSAGALFSGLRQGNRLANTELFLVDGGNPLWAPHMGKAPLDRLTVDELDGSNVLLPMGDDRFPNSFGNQNKAIVFTQEQNRDTAFDVLKQFASTSLLDPSPVGPITGKEEVQFFGVDNLVTGAGDATEGANGVLQARSGIGGQSINLASGVVLSKTKVVATNTLATQTHVAGLDGSIVALVGRNVRDLKPFDTTTFTGGFSSETPGADGLPDGVMIEPGGSLNPAKVVLHDRVLGVVNGSSIAPDNPNRRISLLTILDSQLTGPDDLPPLIPGDTPLPGIPSGKARADVPPLIEVIASTTTSQSAIVTRASSLGGIGQLDKALLLASAPLISLINGQMTTSSDFISVEGNGALGSARLRANVPNDQLILQAAVQLNNSSLNITGHLLNVTGGATASLTGNLVGLANGSALTVTNSLVNLGPNTMFSIQGGSLVAFGPGTNTVNIGGGTCAGCLARTNIPNLPTNVPIVAHPSATIIVEPGFVPYTGVGSGMAGGQPFNNTVNLPKSNLGVLVVGQDATLSLKR